MNPTTLVLGSLWLVGSLALFVVGAVEVRCLEPHERSPFDRRFFPWYVPFWPLLCVAFVIVAVVCIGLDLLEAAPKKKGRKH